MEENSIDVQSAMVSPENKSHVEDIRTMRGVRTLTTLKGDENEEGNVSRNGSDFR